MGAADAMGERRVYVQSVGAYTPLGATWAATCAKLALGKSAVSPVTRFDASGFPSQVAACCGDLAQWDSEPDRRIALARAAVDDACSGAALSVDSARLGVFFGVEPGRPAFVDAARLGRAAGGGGTFDHAAFCAAARGFRAQGLLLSPSVVASAIARDVGAQGPVVTVSLACASGAAAIVEAARALRRGVCDVAIAGGVGADVDPFMLAAFGQLGALSARGASCPFGVRRDGFVLGEGAAAVLLACERGDACVELAGFGRSLDAHHLTAPDPTGSGAVRAMHAALASGGLDRVDYVQAHGTSTPLNDAIEIGALRTVLGPRFADAHVSSVKGALGHAIAGAGAIGFLCGFEAIAAARLLPTAGLTEVDPECNANHVRGVALEKRCDTALVNAFAFGGANCSIGLRRA